MADLRKAAEIALEALRKNRRNHYYCEDQWYSCPKHEDGCANELEGNECNCGADKANQEIDDAITALLQALEQPEREWVGLTDEEEIELDEKYCGDDFNAYIDARDAKLKEKNRG